MVSLRPSYRRFCAALSRHALSVVAIALGVALVVAMRVMNAAVLDSFLETVDAVAGRAAFSVIAPDETSFSQTVVERVAALPGVRLAIPLVTSIAFPNDESGELLLVHGVDLANEAEVRAYRTGGETTNPIDDLTVFLNQPDSILIGRELAERRGLKEGDALELVSPAGVKGFTVRGLLDPDPQGWSRVLNGRLVIMDLYAAQRAFTADGSINRIDVLVDESAAVAAVETRVAAHLPAGLRVEVAALQKNLVRKTIAGFQTMLTAFSLLAVLAGFLICYSRLGAIFEMRLWEVGIMRALGLRQRRIRAELLKESLILGVVGTLAGIPLGIVTGTVGLPLVATATAMNFRLPVAAASPSLRIDAVIIGMLVGLTASLLAAALPALRIARTQPALALTLRGRELPSAPSRFRRHLSLALPLVIAVLVFVQGRIRLAAIGHGTTVLAGLTACVFAVPLVSVGGGPVRSLWPRLFGPTGRLAAGNLTRESRRSALTVATLGVGLGVVLLFGMLGWSFEQTLVSQLTGSLRPDLIVSSACVTGGYWPVPISDRLLGELDAIPGIDRAAGEQNREIRYGDASASLKSFDPIVFRDSRVYRWSLDAAASADALRQAERGDAVMVTRAFSYQYGIHAGDLVSLPSPSGPLQLPVAAVSPAPLESAVLISRDLYRKLWGDPLITFAHVVLEDGVDRPSVAAAIARQLGTRYRLQIRSLPELTRYFAGQVRRAFSVAYLMEAITFLLVVVGLSDTLAAAVTERTREIGMMRAIGLRRSRVLGMMLLEGLAIGLLGLLLAMATGLALGTFWVEMQFPAILGWKLDLHFPAAFASVAALFTLSLCLAASLVPAWQAARLEPARALRYE